MKPFLPILFFFVQPILYGQDISERREYVCYMKSGEINLDGLMDEPSWRAVPWSDNFVDIEGEKKPMPLYETRMKMLWDEDFLYIGIHLEEPHIWATYQERTGLEGMEWEVSKTRFKISARSRIDDRLWHITEDSRVWKQ